MASRYSISLKAWARVVESMISECRCSRLPAPYENGAPSYEELSAFTEPQKDYLVDVIAELQQQWRRDLEQVQQRFLDMLVRAALPGEIAEQRIFSLNARLNITEAKIERRLTFTSVVRRLLPPISTSGMPDSVRSTSSGHRDSLAHGSFRPDCVCRAGASRLAL